MPSGNTAEAFEEIGEIDLAIGWAKQATDFDRGHQSLKTADYRKLFVPVCEDIARVQFKVR